MDSFVAVFMAGSSTERLASIASSKVCAKGPTTVGYCVARLELADDIAEEILQVRPMVVLNALHVPGGEDGVI